MGILRYAEKTGKRVTFNREARARFLDFALDPATRWIGNFRELNAAVTRMATLAPGGRIDPETVAAEIARVRRSAVAVGDDGGLAVLLGSGYEARYDEFELAQLKKVVEVCRNSKSMAEAGKRLFAVSRRSKKSSNDSDRVGKYLARFGLDFQAVRGR